MSGEKCAHCGRPIKPARTVRGGGWCHDHGWETCTADDSPVATPGGPPMSDLTPERRSHLRKWANAYRCDDLPVGRDDLLALLDRADEADRLVEVVRDMAHPRSHLSMPGRSLVVQHQGRPWALEKVNPERAALLARVLEGDDRG